MSAALSVVGPTLIQRAAKWKEALERGDTGPLEVASDVMSIVDEWDTHKSEVGDVSADVWLVRVFRHGRGVAWWRRRAQSVEVLGPWAKRRLAHDAAIYLAFTVPESSRAAVAKLAAEHASKTGTAVCLQTVRRIYESNGKVKRGPRVCGECARLRALLASHGVDPDVT